MLAAAGYRDRASYSADGVGFLQMKKKPTALGVDIFAGLFTCGIKQAGFEVLGHLEHGDYGVATARLNFPKLDVRVGVDNWCTARFKGKVDFIYANPPCAAWSIMRSGSGDWRAPEQAYRMQFIRDVVRVVLDVSPRAWAWESVLGAWRNGREFVMEQAERLCAAGYSATVLLQDNQYLGVPQRRVRMFLIGHKHPLAWPKLTEPVRARDVLASVRRARPRLEEWQPDFNKTPLPRGYDKLWHLAVHHKGRLREAMLEMETESNRMYVYRRPLNTTLRLQPDSVAPVMLNSDMRLHPTELRRISWHEWLAFCGLPPDWKSAVRSADPASRELARAVMPPVGRWLGTAIRNGFGLPALRGKPTIKLVDLRDPENVPAPELLWTLGDHPHERMMARPTPIQDAAVPRRVGYKIGTTKPRPRQPGLPGSGFRIRQMLAEGKTDFEAILKVIRKEFPQSKATKSDVYWNRARLARQGGRP